MQNNLLKNIIHMFQASFFEKIIAILIFLCIPNMLSIYEYSQVVTITVLLSFLPLFSLGIVNIYKRRLPSIFENATPDTIEKYNQTFFWFIIITGIVGSIVLSTYFFIRYQNYFLSFLLSVYFISTVLLSFNQAELTVKENFKEYKYLLIRYSAFKLIVIPFTYILGIFGWILSMVISIS